MVVPIEKTPLRRCFFVSSKDVIIIHMISLFIGVYLLCAGVFAVTHLVALSADLYWYFWWFDILMHGWGGFLVIYGLAVIRSLSSLAQFVPRASFAQAAVLLVVVIVWELFEYGIGTGLKTEFWNDTLLDIVMGFFGGLFAYVLLKKYFKPEQT